MFHEQRCREERHCGGSRGALRCEYRSSSRRLRRILTKIMHEILRNLEPGAKVLDLGSGAWGSVSASAYPHLVLIRLDNEFPESSGDGLFVQGDAAQLAFGDGSFDSVIANHSLEHVANLPMALAEIG